MLTINSTLMVPPDFNGLTTKILKSHGIIMWQKKCKNVLPK